MTKEKINLEIKGTPLIKFQSAERIESLQHGHIYAKTLAYYRMLEKETETLKLVMALRRCFM